MWHCAISHAIALQPRLFPATLPRPATALIGSSSALSSAREPFAERRWRPPSSADGQGNGDKGAECLSGPIMIATRAPDDREIGGGQRVLTSQLTLLGSGGSVSAAIYPSVERARADEARQPACAVAGVPTAARIALFLARSGEPGACGRCGVPTSVTKSDT
jgi:hypothetical protein